MPVGCWQKATEPKTLGDDIQASKAGEGEKVCPWSTVAVAVLALGPRQCPLGRRTELTVFGAALSPPEEQDLLDALGPPPASLIHPQ